MKNRYLTLIVMLLIALPFAYLLKVYPQLPAVIPTHFGLDGNANGFSGKHTLIGIVVFMSLISAGIFFLIKYLPRIDPKKTASMNAALLPKIAVTVVALESAVTIMLIYASVHGRMFSTRLLYPLTGIFFAVMGNLMYNIKPNYFVGVRVPWTLENENNWRATHHLAGRLWFGGGLLITVCTLILPVKAGDAIFLAGICILVLCPVIYSFVYFRNHQEPKTD